MNISCKKKKDNHAKTPEWLNNKEGLRISLGPENRIDFRVDWGWVRLGTGRIRCGEREVKSVIYTYIQLYVVYAIPYGAVEVAQWL